MAQLMCDALAVGYGERVIVRNLSFEIFGGDYLCIVGENGAGKSTLARTLLGLQRPLLGSVAWGDGLTRGEIGYLPQQTDVQRDFPASVAEVVLSGCLNRCGLRPFYRRAEREAARRNMELLHIAPLARRCYRELSGGQQRRVLLARALCATRKLLLLDEPVAGLDPLTSLAFYALIRDLNVREGITVMMVTHDLPAALADASHVLHVGREPLFFGAARDYLNSAFGRRFANTSGGERIG
ncbi:MAG: ATP-binding cassette domain-containing protein [Clostridiales bacterium]|nr:ATP-binding cassette domain-containing protein [Clostridiales bacterium]